MKIIAHRGLWSVEKDKNSLDSLLLAIKLGFGVETDIRDYNGKLVISHDPPFGKPLLLSEFVENAMVIPKFRKTLLAFNIKSDGLGPTIKKLLLEYKLKNQVFLFDMSVPEHYFFTTMFHKGNICTRHSDIERHPILYERSKWVWLDSFEEDWITKNVVSMHLKNGKFVVLVSPELHKKAYKKFWKKILPFSYNPKVAICTDFPVLAKAYFHSR